MNLENFILCSKCLKNNGFEENEHIDFEKFLQDKLNNFLKHIQFANETCDKYGIICNTVKLNSLCNISFLPSRSYILKNEYDSLVNEYDSLANDYEYIEQNLKHIRHKRRGLYRCIANLKRTQDELKKSQEDLHLRNEKNEKEKLELQSNIEQLNSIISSLCKNVNYPESKELERIVVSEKKEMFKDFLYESKAMKHKFNSELREIKLERFKPTIKEESKKRKQIIKEQYYNFCQIVSQEILIEHFKVSQEIYEKYDQFSKDTSIRFDIEHYVVPTVSEEVRKRRQIIEDDIQYRKVWERTFISLTETIKEKTRNFLLNKRDLRKEAKKPGFKHEGFATCPDCREYFKLFEKGKSKIMCCSKHNDDFEKSFKQMYDKPRSMR